MKSLLFVYQADGDMISSFMGAAHKIISPETYTCNLCRLTYGALKEKTAWKNYLKGLNYSAEFLHRDKFRQRFLAYSSINLPAIFWLIVDGENQSLNQLISAEQLNQIKTLDQLTMSLNLALNLETKNTAAETN